VSGKNKNETCGLVTCALVQLQCQSCDTVAHCSERRTCSVSQVHLQLVCCPTGSHAGKSQQCYLVHGSISLSARSSPPILVKPLQLWDGKHSIPPARVDCTSSLTPSSPRHMGVGTGRWGGFFMAAGGENGPDGLRVRPTQLKVAAICPLSLHGDVGRTSACAQSQLQFKLEARF
jgi:hypothetical protein